MKAEIVRREFDTALELVTPPVSPERYRRKVGDVYTRLDGVEYRYDAYLPAANGPPPPVVVFVHGDGPLDFLREPRLWGQCRSWAALTASRGMAAIGFDHASSEGRTRMPSVVAQIEQLLDLIGERADDLGVDAERIAVWSGSAGVPFGFVASIGRPNIRCQVAFYGPMDLRVDTSRTAPEVSEAELVQFSPITQLEERSQTIQPTLFVKAGLDRPGINDSIDAFLARARALGAPVHLLVHDQGRHAFDVLDEGNRSRELIEATLDFMATQLRP